MESGTYLTIKERKMLTCKRRNVRLFGFQLERLKIHQLIMYYCFLMFIISVNYGANLYLYLFYILGSEMGRNHMIHLKLYFQSCPKIKLASLIRSKFLILGHKKAESELSFIL